MNRLQTFFSKPITQIVLIFSVAALLYFLLPTSSGDINDFTIQGQYAYLANGSAGLRILDLDDPTNITLAGYVRCRVNIPILDQSPIRYRNCGHQVNSVWISPPSIFFTDRRRGLFIANLSSDPTAPEPLDQLQLPGTPQDVVIFEDHAYVATGRQGVRIVKIIPLNRAGNQDESTNYRLGEVEYKPLANAGNALRIYTNQGRIYWTDNRDTLNIWDVKSNKNEPKELGKFNGEFPFNDITFYGEFALVAAGDQGLVILDTSDPANLKVTSKLSLDGIAQGLSLNGNYIYLTVEDLGLVIVDISYITDPRLVEKPFELEGEPTEIIVQGDLAYVANQTSGLSSYQVGVQIKTESIGQSGAPVIATGVAKSGNLALLATMERGMRVIDVSNASRPVEVAFLDTPGIAAGVAVSGSAAYIADHQNGLVVADLTNPVGSLPILTTIPRKQVRDVVVQGNYAYLADSEAGLAIVDISRPISSTLTSLMQLPDGVAISPTGVAVLGDYAYLADGIEGFSVVNVFDKKIPTLLQQVKVPGQMDVRNIAVIAFNPQAAATPGMDPYQPDMNDPATKVYAYVANGIYGLQLLDVTRPEQQVPVQINLDSSITTLAGVAMDVSIVRDRAYLAYDGVGLYILDTTNPAAPKLVGMLSLPQTENRAVGLTADTAMVYLAALDHGLIIVDATNTAAPTTVGQFSAPASVLNMAIQGDYAYTVDGTRGLWIFDLINPETPQEIHFVSIPEASGVFLDDSHAYVAAGSNGLRIVNISDPKNSYIEGSLDTEGFAQAVLVIRRPGSDPPIRYAYIADGANGLIVMDVSNPATPVRVGSLAGIGTAFRLTYDGNDYIYVSANEDGLVAVNVVDPTRPALMSITNQDGITRGMATLPLSTGYVAAGDDGMLIIDISYPLKMVILESNQPGDGGWIENLATPQVLPASGTITSTLTIPPNYAFIADRDQGVFILDTINPLIPLRSGEWLSPVIGAEGGAEPEIMQVIPYWIPPPIEEKDPGNFQFYVADAQNGFYIVKGEKKASILYLDTFETGRTATLANLQTYFKSKSNGVTFPFPYTSKLIWQVLLDIVLIGVVGFFLWVGCLTIFILPVSRYVDWEKLSGRLVFFFFSRHGPLSRVRGGKLVGDRDEQQRPGPGVIIVDVDSAVVLEKRNVRGANRSPLPLARVAGPGVVYTGNRTFLNRLRYDEVIRGIIDLRPQVRLASGVNAYSRDGIEVVTVVSSIFTLGEAPDVLYVTYIPPEPADASQPESPGLKYQPEARDLRVVTFSQAANSNWQVDKITDELDEEDKQEIHQFLLKIPSLQILTNFEDTNMKHNGQSGAPFNIDPVRIFQAVYAQAEDPPQGKQIDWTELPTLVAIEKFRNLLAGEIYDHLYEPSEPSNYPIRKLKGELNRWLRNQGVLAFQYIRRSDQIPLHQGQEIPKNDLVISVVQALGNPKILRSRGIKVKLGNFGELTPTNDDVRKQFLDYWQAQREQDVDFILGDSLLSARRLENRYRFDAQKEILEALTDILDSNPNADEALAIHVLQALENAALEPDTSLMLPEDTIEMLRNLRNWLLRPGG
jgi:hypothetical protein